MTKIIRIITTDLRIVSNNRLRKALPKIIIFAANNRNSTANSSSECEMVI